MFLTRRAFSLSLLALPAMPLAARGAEDASLLERFFTGRTEGDGLFESGLAGVRRPFTVRTVGTLEGRTLVLREFIAYADGQRDEAVWRFDKTGPGRYDGQRTGVAGVVPVRETDGAVRMGYVAEVKGTDGAPMKLRFEDTLRLLDERTLLNTADVRFLGLKVGTVSVTFHNTR